jgi:DNA polymerase delta subunit 1
MSLDPFDFFPVTWSVSDHDAACFVSACGKTIDGKEVCVHASFTPYFLAEMPRAWSDARARAFTTEMAQRHGGILGRCVPVRRTSAWGFTNGEQRVFAQLAFPTLAAMRRAKYAVARQHDTYDSTEPLLRVFHLRNVAPAGWVRVSAWADHTDRADRVSRCDLEVHTTFEGLSPSPPDVAGAPPPLVVASEYLHELPHSFAANGQPA